VPTTAGVDEQQGVGEEHPEGAAEDEVRARLRRGRLVVAIVAGVLVVVVGVVALLGGFRARTDLQTRVAPGSVIATGSLEVTLDHATVQRVTSSGGFRVVASGTARTTGTTSIDPGTGDDGFLFARSTSTAEVQASDSITLGSTDALLSVEHLTPGVPPVPWSVTFNFAKDPGPTVFLAVFGQQYTTPYIFGDELGWQTTDDASTLTLPLGSAPDVAY
jgi:hypothetical protein